MKLFERNGAVGADDFGGADIRCPKGDFGNRAPLGSCSVESYTRQTGALIERIRTNARHAVGNHDIFQVYRILKSAIQYLCHGFSAMRCRNLNRFNIVSFPS